LAACTSRAAPKSDVFLRIERSSQSSRAMLAELVDLSTISLRRSLVRACCYFGGTIRQWLFDHDHCHTPQAGRAHMHLNMVPSLIDGACCI
jgi:hypothetical protein